MDLSPAQLFAAMLVGTIGMGIFIYGKREARIPQIVAGVALMVWPYVVPDVTWMLVSSCAIVAVLWFATTRL